MKWLRSFLLLAVVFAAGCSGPTDTAEDANDPTVTSEPQPVNEAAEAPELAPEH